jgi:hypothetical protein
MREDIKSIAIRFVDLLATDEALRKETADSFGLKDAEAVLARIVNDHLKLEPPLETKDIGALEDAMAEIYRKLRRRKRLPNDIRGGNEFYSTGRG